MLKTDKIQIEYRYDKNGKIHFNISTFDKELDLMTVLEALINVILYLLYKNRKGLGKEIYNKIIKGIIKMITASVTGTFTEHKILQDETEGNPENGNKEGNT